MDEEELGYARLNIILPKDTLAKLDKFKDNAGLASRGRTIQALVDTVWDIQFDTKIMIAKLNESKSDSEYLHNISSNLMNISRRIAIFELK